MIKFLRSIVFVIVAASFLLTACGTSGTPAATEAPALTAGSSQPTAAQTATPLAPGSRRPPRVSTHLHFRWLILRW